jgi:diaminopimelate epimerase
MSSDVGVDGVASAVDRVSNSGEETARSEMEFLVACWERVKSDAKSCGTGAIVCVQESSKKINSSTLGRSHHTVDSLSSVKRSVGLLWV